MRWTAHIEGGPRRVNHAAACIDGKIYSFGGYCSSEEFYDWGPIPVYVLNTETLRWKEIACKQTKHTPFQRYGHTAVAYGNKIYVWGGRNNTVACEKVSCFDTETRKWSTAVVTGSAPAAKDGHSACVINNKMYVFGGYQYLSNSYSQDVHCLNLDTMKWRILNVKGDPPSQRDFHTAVPYKNKIYVFGGRGEVTQSNNTTEEVYCQQVIYLDLDKEEWVYARPSGTCPIGRRSHSAWIYDDCMYIFGGFNGRTTRTHFNDLYRYRIAENRWECVVPNGQQPTKRRRQVCLPYGDKMFLFGGTSPNPDAPADEADEDAERLMDNNDLHVLDYQPTLKTLSMMAVLEHGLDTAVLPRDIILELRIMTEPNTITFDIELQNDHE